MEIACLDLEGVLIPEIWIGFADKTGIEELRATTRDIPDYDVLMRQRLGQINTNERAAGGGRKPLSKNVGCTWAS